AREGPGEARMQSEVNEASAGLEDAGGLREHGRVVADVGVDEDGCDRTEGAVLEGKVGGISPDELHVLAGAVAGNPELVDGRVDAGDAPAERVQGLEVEAAATAEVEHPARPGAEERDESLARGERELAEVLVVVVGDSVVPRRGRHRFDGTQ